jgi:hypothetical protein
VFPLPRKDGTELYYAQLQAARWAFTSLAEFQLHRENAPPHLLIDVYPELAASHVRVLR